MSGTKVEERNAAGALCPLTRLPNKIFDKTKQRAERAPELLCYAKIS